MVVSWGLGGGVEPGSQSAAPGIWVTAADSGRFVVGGLQVSHRDRVFAPTPAIGARAKRSACPQVGVPGLARGGTSVQTGTSLKLSTGSLLWNGGSRVPRHDEGPVSLYSLLFGRHPDEPTKPISTAPSGVRFGVSSRAIAQFQRPADLHPRSLGRPQAVQVKAAPFLVQEVPLPLSPHPAGAAWLKLKATAPPVGGVFDRAGAFYQQTAGQKGALSGELVADAVTNGDYSRLALGVRAPLRVQQLASGQYRGVCEPPEFYAKLQHNNQRFSASWHEINGLRLSMTHAF